MNMAPQIQCHVIIIHPSMHLSLIMHQTHLSHPYIYLLKPKPNKQPIQALSHPIH